MTRAAALSAVLLFLVPLALNAQQKGDFLYHEEDGVVVFEVESSPAVPDWTQETKMQGYTGAGYYTWTGADRYGSPGAGVLTYKFVITNPGKYNMRLRNRHDFHDSTLQNDCFTKMDGDKWNKTFSSQRGQWTWATMLEPSHGHHIQAQYTLGAGVHTFQICGRSKGFSIDRVHFFIDGTRDAIDEKRPESKGLPATPELKKLTQVAGYWKDGKLGYALDAAEKALESEDAEEKAEANEVVNILKAYADKQVKKMESLKEKDPLMAVELLGEVGKKYLPSQTGRDMQSMASKWSMEPEVRNEKRARSILSAVEKAASEIREGGKATDEKFFNRYRRQLTIIHQGTRKLQKSYPDTWSCRKAVDIANRFGVPLK